MFAKSNDVNLRLDPSSTTPGVKLDTRGDGDCALRALVQGVILQAIAEGKVEKLFEPNGFFAKLIQKQHTESAIANGYRLPENLQEQLDLMKVFIEKEGPQAFINKYINRGDPTNVETEGEQFITALTACMRYYLLDGKTEIKDGGDVVLNTNKGQHVLLNSNELNKRMHNLGIYRTVSTGNGEHLAIRDQKPADTEGFGVLVLHSGTGDEAHFDAVISAEEARKLAELEKRKTLVFEAEAPPEDKTQVFEAEDKKRKNHNYEPSAFIQAHVIHGPELGTGLRVPVERFATRLVTAHMSTENFMNKLIQLRITQGQVPNGGAKAALKAITDYLQKNPTKVTGQLSLRTVLEQAIPDDDLRNRIQGFLNLKMSKFFGRNILDLPFTADQYLEFQSTGQWLGGEPYFLQAMQCLKEAAFFEGMQHDGNKILKADGSVAAEIQYHKEDNSYTLSPSDGSPESIAMMSYMMAQMVQKSQTRVMTISVQDNLDPVRLLDFLQKSIAGERMIVSNLNEILPHLRNQDPALNEKLLDELERINRLQEFSERGAKRLPSSWSAALHDPLTPLERGRIKGMSIYSEALEQKPPYTPTDNTTSTMGAILESSQPQPEESKLTPELGAELEREKPESRGTTGFSLN